MKVRAGFVSNSSSEAFICGSWGKCEYNIEETVVILQKMIDFYNDMEKTDISYDQMFEMPKMADEKDFKLLEGWEIQKSRVEGKMIIYSVDDNSVPYELFGLIESKFNADRIHLG